MSARRAYRFRKTRKGTINPVRSEGLMKRTYVLLFAFLLPLTCLLSCTTQMPPQPAQQATPSEQAAEAPGVPLKERYKLEVINRAGKPVTVSVNGEWVGQWDINAYVPLENVVAGKNELTVELPEAPEKEIRIGVYTRRQGETVYLLSLNFQGKSGSHTHAFVVK
jgi:hypothetical protein